MDPAAVVLLVKDLDDEHDPNEDTGSLGENFVADFSTFLPLPTLSLLLM